MTAPSGGQAQRVAIGRALAARPAILLLDEPFSALDQELRSSMHELLAQLRKRLAPTILMVSHDRDEAAAVADHIAVLSRCGLLQDDRVDLLYSRPASLEVHRLMGGTNEITGTVRGGVHYSALGDLDLPADTDWPDGPGVMVIRQESISILDDARGPAGHGVPAIATDMRVLGPRRLVTVDVSGVTLQTEAPGGRLLGTGDAIRITIPVSARALIADPPGTGGPTTGDTAAAVMATGRT